MTLFKKCLMFVLLTLNINIVSANSISKELEAICGERSCDVIFKKVKKFAKNGSPHAQAVLALFYRGGYGTEMDNELSLKYMKRAAKSNLPFAQYDLGILYRLGHTVEKDEAESEFWLKRSAEGGHTPAIELLLSENKISKEKDMTDRNIQSWPNVDEGTEHIVITREKYTLSHLVEYLNGLGYGRNHGTGSRIRGQGCGNGASTCAIWQVNSPLGRTQFNTMISNINAIQTGAAMGGRIK